MGEKSLLAESEKIRCEGITLLSALFLKSVEVFFWLQVDGEWREMVTSDSTDVNERPQRNSMSTARWIKQRQTV